MGLVALADFGYWLYGVPKGLVIRDLKHEQNLSQNQYITVTRAVDRKRLELQHTFNKVKALKRGEHRQKLLAKLPNIL